MTFGDPQSLEQAMEGVDPLFLACGNVPDQVQHKKAAIAAARAAGVQRVVKLSGPRAALDAPVIFDRWHPQIEQYLLDSGLAWVLLRPSTFVTNVLQCAAAVAGTGHVVDARRRGPGSFVDPRDIAEVAATVPVSEDGTGGAPSNGSNRIDGQVYRLTGPEAVTHAQLAEALSVSTGSEIRYVDVPAEAARDVLLGKACRRCSLTRSSTCSPRSAPATWPTSPTPWSA